ncbi:MAG: hypothetical protein A2V86_16865 [Deltaproteobacteria bacterium RBG_16_49_23]|nr:MAG: hypothetical protein A2V86_16865 [Deltaproteobacteria bacterium RBG_16_49_23]
MDSHEGSLSGVGKEFKAIHRILVKILDKWRTETQEGTEEALNETLIISPETYQKKTSPPLRDQETEEILQKTVIFSPQGTTGREGFPPAHEPEEISEKDQFSEETVILKPGKIRGKAER